MIYRNLIYIKNDSLNESTILTEAKNSNYKVGDTITVQFNNKSYKAKIESSYKGNDIEQILSRIDNCLKTINGNDLWNYLWNFQYQYVYGIKEEGFTSSKDIKNAITNIRLIKIGGEGELYIAGCSKFDDEHGFAVVFPKGKYIKSKYDKFNYNRDCGEDVNYVPQCTYGSDESFAIQQ